MKVEVVDCSTHQTSQTYLLPEAQVSDFKELEMTSECIPMTELRHLVKDLETFHCEGTEDSESIPVPVPVDLLSADSSENQGVFLVCRAAVARTRISRAF